MYGRVYSKRFAGPLQLVLSTNIVLFTVPAGFTYVIRSIAVVNNSATAAAACRVGIGPPNVGANRIMRLSVLANETMYFACMVPLTAGEQLQASGDTVALPTITVSGYELVS